MTLKSGNITALVMSGLFYPATGVLPPIWVDTGVLSYSPAVILKQFIIDITLLQNPSGSAEWPCYIGMLPDGFNIPDDASCVYDDAGYFDGMMAGNVAQHYGVSLIVRSKEYQDGWKRIHDIADQFDLIAYLDITVGIINFQIQNVTREKPILIKGQKDDSKRRYNFELNLAATIREYA